MTLTEKIKRELSVGPGTAEEIAATVEAEKAMVSSLLCNMYGRGEIDREPTNNPNKAGRREWRYLPQPRKGEIIKMKPRQIEESKGIPAPAPYCRQLAGWGVWR